MLTTRDIQKLIEVMKTFFYTKEEMDAKFEEQNIKFSTLQSSVDGIAKNFIKNDQEQTILTDRVNELETWVKKTSKKIGVGFET